MQARFSVVIPVYKIKEEYLRKCLNSLLIQSCELWEAILVDDGSPDNCGSICEEFANANKNFKVYHQTNQGVSVARNSGIDKCSTEWITFIDPDDWVETNWAESISETIDKFGSSTDIILFDYYQNYAFKEIRKQLSKDHGFLSKNLVSCLRKAPFNQFIVEGKHVIYETNVIWSKVYKKNLFTKNGVYFDPEARKGQDVILNAEIFQIAQNFYYINKPLYHYRYIEQSVTNRFNKNVVYYNEVAFNNYERIIEKFDLDEEYVKLYNARVLTRLYSCMRLYYFHKDNNMQFKDICKEINNILNKQPYSKAMKQIDLSVLPFTYCVFVFFLKRQNYLFLKFLVKLRIVLQLLRGARLG